MSTPTVPFVDLRAQYQTIETKVNDAVRAVMESRQFILGDEVARFEGELAQFIGVRHCVGVSNGLEALWLSLRALGIGAGDEVVMQANTYIATALAVTAVGAKPVLVDSDPRTQQVDVAQLESAVTPRTRALIPVHLGGVSADMDAVLDIARRHDLRVIEDSAQAHGTHYKGRVCGAMGDAGCFSFYPGKNLGAYGDAGAITTNDDAVAKSLRRLRNYGQDVKYHHVERGWNARLDTMQAAVLRVKLPLLASWNSARAAHAARYRRELAGLGDLRFQESTPGSDSCYHLFMVETVRRDALREHLTASGIETVMHYPIPIHLSEAYRDLGYERGAFPNAEAHSRETLSLPMYAELTDEQIAQVAGAVRRFFASRK